MSKASFGEDKKIEYPYMPEGRSLRFASPDNEFMAQALYAIESMDSRNHPTAAVLVIDGKVVGRAQNQADHRSFCPRTALGSISGQEYELCPNHCHPKNHSEPNVIKSAREAGVEDFSKADIYLAGHWWVCKPCWDSAIEAGVRNIYLLEGAHDRYEGDGKQRREIAERSGKFEGEMKVAVLGPSKEDFITALSKVGIEYGEDLNSVDAVLLLPGYDGENDFSGKKVFDCRDSANWQNALTQFSIELEM